MKHVPICVLLFCVVLDYHFIAPIMALSGKIESTTFAWNEQNLVLYARADWNEGTGPFGEWHQEPLSFCLVMFEVRERDLAGLGIKKEA